MRAEAPARRTAEPIRLSPTPLYARDRDSVIVPLPFLELPPELHLVGLDWHRKQELHVTAAHTKAIAERVGPVLELDQPAAVERVWTALGDAIRNAVIGDVALRAEFFRIEQEGDRTLIAMCDVEGLDDLYRRLGEELGTRVEPPPWHVTIYTAEPGGGGIGVHTHEQLGREGDPLPPEAASALGAAMAAAAPG